MILGLASKWHIENWIHYCYLTWLFCKRDISVQIKQTIFGLTWHVINPILTTTVYTIVFGVIAGIPTDGMPKPLFYLSGICLWTYFSRCLTKISDTLSRNAHIYGKVYFPRIIIPISIVFSQLLPFFIQFVLFFLVKFWYLTQGVSFSAIRVYFFPIVLVMTASFALGLGLLITSLSIKYRDLKMAFPLLLQLWMYVTPIIFPLTMVTELNIKQWMLFNPLTELFEMFKLSVLGVGCFDVQNFLYSFIIILLTLIFGIYVFYKKQTDFIDKI